MKARDTEFLIHPSALIPHPFVYARVAQLTERWSYKPEVEGLNPSLGTTVRFQVSGLRFQVHQTRLETLNLKLETWNLSGRDSSRQNGDCLGAWSSHGRV